MSYEMKGTAAMCKRVGIGLMMLMIGGLLLPLTTAAAASEQPDDSVVIWNEDYTLAEDDALNGSLIVFNGDATIKTSSRVRGDVVVWNGNVDVNGVIEGDLVASNGYIQLDKDARVQGDVVCTWNCRIRREEGSRVEGELVRGPSLRGIPFARLGESGLSIRRPSVETEPLWLSGPEQLLRRVLRTVRRMVTVLVLAATAGLVALIWPEATTRVSHAAFDWPGASLGVGLLTVVSAGALAVALAITICLSPAALLIALALGAAGLFGWAAVGARVGGRFLRALDVGKVTPLWSASLGTLVITLVSMGLSNAFCLSPLGWFLIVVVGSLGLGAVVLTRLGTTAYIPDHHRELTAPELGPESGQTATESVPEGEGKVSEDTRGV